VVGQDTDQCTGQRRGGGGVANADLPEHQAIDPARGELDRQPSPRRHRRRELLLGQSGLGGHVGRPLGHLGVADAGRCFADEPDVGDQKLVVADGGKNAERGFTARRGSGDLRGDDTVEQARATVNVTVVGGADQDACVEMFRRWRPGDLGPALDQGLQCAEAASGLDELVQAVSRGDHGRSVDTSGPTDGGLHGDLVFAPPFVHHDPVEG
jgi:hypothetical protein